MHLESHTGGGVEGEHTQSAFSRRRRLTSGSTSFSVLQYWVESFFDRLQVLLLEEGVGGGKEGEKGLSVVISASDCTMVYERRME